jgi:hypothetical protein
MSLIGNRIKRSEEMKPSWNSRKKWIRILAVVGFLAAGAAFSHGCGEDTLPPPGPGNTGTIVVTGGAV